MHEGEVAKSLSRISSGLFLCLGPESSYKEVFKMFQQDVTNPGTPRYTQATLTAEIGKECQQIK